MTLFDEAFAPYRAFGSRTLTQSDAGTDVAVAQAIYNLMLDMMHPPRGPMGSPLKVTGAFDSHTKQAVVNIQEYFGIRKTGLLLFSIYSGATTVQSFSCGIQSYPQGQTGGQDAIRLAQNVGQPQGSAIYLDLQPRQLSAVIPQAPCPSKIWIFASLWPYALQVTLCNSPGCNIDSAQSTPLACGACKLLPRPCSPSPACA